MQQGLIQDQGKHKISETVQDIVRDAGGPVGESSAGAAGNQIGNGAEGAEQQPEGARDHSPENGGIHLLKQKDDDGKNTPDVQVTDPPDAETENDPLQKHKGIDDRKNLSLIGQGVKNDQCGNRFNIRKK